MPQWLARADRAVSRLHLERLFLGRHKFYHFRVWFRDQLWDYLSGLEAGHAQPFCYRDGIVRTMVNAHVTGRANHTLDIHRIVTLRLTEKMVASQR
jgi:asparagine synthase (glutamine-hydrolysing)